MLPLLFNLKFILPVLLLLNALGVLWIRKELRYIKAPVMLLSLLLLIYLGYRFLVFPQQIRSVQSSRQAEIKKQGWNYLKDPEKDNTLYQQEKTYQQTNLFLFRLIGLQAAFSFIFSCIGLFISTDKKIYASFALGFIVLAYLFIT